jgi:cyclophilin family peptidyl-prolyl cis-trans isomerase
MNYKVMTVLLAMIAVLVVVFGCSNNQSAASNHMVDDKLSETNTNGDENMANQIVVIETNKGNIEVELDQNKAPITAENFLSYVNESFFDGTIFHRVIPNFMIQGGGFLPNGSQKKTHAPIILESRNGLKNMRGTIAMARTNVPNSATAQFFINTKNNDFLDYRPGNDGYAVFGKVISGMDVVDAIEKVNTTTKGFNQDWPVNDVIINSIHLKK